MASLVQELESIDRLLADAMGSSCAGGGDLRFTGDAELLDVVQVLGRVQRRLDGAIVAVTGQVVERDQVERDARFSTRAGCHDAAELLRRTLLVDGPAARRYVSAAGAVRREQDITSGVLLPGKFPELTAALAGGFLSVGGFLACTVPLQKAVRISVADRLAADAVLARFASGLPLDGTELGGSERAPLPTTDELAALVAHIIARLDPDGAEPSDRAGKRRRHFTIGKLRDGSVPVRGELLPEVAAQLQKLVDSLMNPKAEDKAGAGSSTVRFRPSDDSGDGDRADHADRADESNDASPVANDASAGDSSSDSDSTSDSTSHDAGDGDDWFDAKYSSSSTEYGARVDSDRADGLEPHKAQSPPEEAADLRTHAQKRHDAFATALMVAAASGGMPTLGGAAPTLVVSVTAEDFTNRTGRATVEGAGYDVPLGAADHAACVGGVQRVLFDEKGAIVAIGTTARLFNAVQRRAIVLRDRKCLIPGCDVPAEWCEIHHVEDHASGGPTHTSNGVPLCWHHHRTLDEDIWHIRMRNGKPEIRGPGWWDPYAKWRDPHLKYQAIDEALNTELERAQQPEPAWNTWCSQAVGPEMKQMVDVDLVVFDVLGTLVDEPEGLRSAIREAFPRAGASEVRSLAESRQRNVADQQTEIAEGHRAYVDSEVLDTESALVVIDAAADLGVVAASDSLSRLATASRRLPPWPDSVAELERIAALLPVLVLSNAAPTTLLHLAASSGLRWHQAVTAHDVAAYKPAPALYQRAVRVADCAPERILMVAAHAWDLRAAQAAGMRTCYVDRPVGDPPLASDRFDAIVGGLDDLFPALG